MPIPAPKAGEKQDEFIGRCNTALASEFPETKQRNAVCFDVWRESKQAREMQRLAREAFPDEKFVTHKNVAIFDEHETELEDGTKKVYDRDELVAIAEKCNDRILDTGDFSPITDGHTPDEEGLPDPDVLGFASNFQVGLLGNKKPRWAIFIDEHIKRDEEERAKTKPRTSVEIWPSDRVIDPIARLGATTPRRDLGLRPTFSKVGGKERYRYSMSYAAEASSTNTFVPGFPDKEKDQMADAPITPDVTAPVEGNDDTVQRVVDALMETPQFKFLTDLMEESVPVEETPDEAPDELARDEDDEDEPVKNQDEEDEDEDEKMRKDRNSRKAARDSKLEVQKLRKELDEVKADRTADKKRDLDRYKRSELDRLSPHFVYDIDDELKLCDTMSEKQFDDHCEHQIMQKYRQKPTGMRELATDNSVTQPPPGHGEKMKYEAEISKRVQEKALSLRNEGKNADYDTIREQMIAADVAAGNTPE